MQTRRAMATCTLAAQRDAGGEGGAQSLVSYSAGISACEKGEQWQRALALLSEMREAKGEPDVTLIYSAGISACGNGEQWKRALALLSEMREAKGEPDSIRQYPALRVREGQAMVTRGGAPGAPPVG
ncbi:unnamed protein product [Prorocentrum cordatum]|uniref:Pentacotripeptide-repeat region of PRORP domain-containing protein n=1 Tax=Prorocentrum cordatum TaxID=2364126 RepID=A0ABN9S3Y7_9DINO|nr:unnamed protein product [Polarella glacialis]